MRIAMIAAMASNRVIGHNNRLPWHLSDDLKFFKRHTLEKVLIMGRKTFDSIGRPLPKRTTIVITRNPDWHYDGVLVAHSLQQALILAEPLIQDLPADQQEIMIAGGAEIYRQALASSDRLYLTQVHCEPEGDAFFPEYDPSQWTIEWRESHGQDENNDHDFDLVILQRQS